MDNVDATIRRKLMPPKNKAYKCEMVRLLLAVLRQADGPLKTSELTRHVMAERGLNTADKKLVKAISKRVGSCLRHHRSKGTVRSVKGPESFLLWEIAG